MKSNLTKEQLETMQKNTENFLCSYHLQKAMASVSGYDEDESCATSEDVELVEPMPFNAELAEGQIRLLRDVERITYVVLLRRWEENSFLTMAFSHYDFPATDEEFKPVFDGGAYLNTLQVWNTRTLHDETLAKSWCIGTLPESDCADAWTFWSHLINGHALPGHLLSRMGTPITEPDDIRVGYLEEELAVFREVDSADLSAGVHVGEKTEWTNPWLTVSLDQLVLPPLWDRSEMSLAAGSAEEDVNIECRLDGFAERLTLVYSPHEGKLRLNVYDAAGEDDAFVFDGWGLVDENGAELGKISKGFCSVEVPRLAVGAFALRDSAGALHALGLDEEMA